MILLGSIEALTMAVIIVIALGYLHHAGMHQAQAHAEDALRLIRAAVAESLFVVNDNSAREVIDWAFYEVQAISYLQVVGDDGAIIAEKRKGSSLIPGRNLYLTDTIELGGVVFGTLHMQFCTQSIVDSVRRQSLILGAFALLGLVLSSLLTWFAVGKLGDLLQAMESGLRDLAYQTPAEALAVPPSQELGRLVQAYNQLVERLHPS